MNKALVGLLASVLFGAIIVIDGDTVDRDGVRYRLLGFDAPETVRARCAREQRLGEHATKRLQELVTQRHAELRSTGQIERWGRTLAYLMIDGEDVATIAVREGWGRRYDGGRRESWCRSTRAEHSSAYEAPRPALQPAL